MGIQKQQQQQKVISPHIRALFLHFRSANRLR